MTSLNPFDADHDDADLGETDAVDATRSADYLDERQAEADAEVVRRILQEKRLALLRNHGTVEQRRAFLVREGCGAYSGTDQCGKDPVGFRSGDAILAFQSYLGAWATDDGLPHADGLYVVACCARHAGATAATLLQDCDALTHAQQMAAAARWASEWGNSLTLGKPPGRSTLSALSSGLLLP